MTWSVTFGTTLVSNTTGYYEFTPGMMQRKYANEQLPRAMGEIAKDMGMTGCDHQLVVTLLAVAPANVATVHNAFAAIAAPTGRVAAKSLIVPNYDAFPNCICTACSCVKLAVRGTYTTIGQNGPVNTLCYDMTFNLTFHQLRR